MPGMEPERDPGQLLEDLAASESGAQLLAFYWRNPGVVETVASLARRLGANVEQLRTDVAAQVRLGLLHEVTAGAHVILVPDRHRSKEIQRAFPASAMRVADLLSAWAGHGAEAGAAAEGAG